MAILGFLDFEFWKKGNSFMRVHSYTVSRTSLGVRPSSYPPRNTFGVIEHCSTTTWYALCLVYQTMLGKPNNVLLKDTCTVCRTFDNPVNRFKTIAKEYGQSLYIIKQSITNSIAIPNSIA